MANNEISKKLFENKTTYTTNDYVLFLKFHNKRFNFSYSLYTIFWSFLFLLCIILSFNSGARLQGVVITIILLCFIIYRFVRPKMVVENELKGDKFSGNNTNIFSFYDKDFEVYNKNGKFRYKYFMLNQVFETQDFFYLYATKENAFLVSKNAFSLGTAKDFSVFLKVKCKSKYKLVNF